MPAKLGPRCERDAAMAAANCADVRARFAARQRSAARFADAVTLNPDLALGVVILLGSMSRDTWQDHPLLLAAA